MSSSFYLIVFQWKRLFLVKFIELQQFEKILAPPPG